MTAENLLDHDVSSTFVWDDKYRHQLQVLAETDEMMEDIVWPSLKDAIKYTLKETFRTWPSSSSPILHPAAALIPLQSSTASFDDGSTSIGYANGNDANGVQAHEQERQRAAGIALSSRFAREGREPPEPEDDYEQNDQNISIREVDMQAFFPSKRQAPSEWLGSWGRRIDSEEEMKGEERTIFGMLDDFENQPPFTIQRLAELVLQPTEHHHTLPKYASALKRLLSVTATRDAFPAHPGEEEEDDEEMNDESVGAHQHINGLTATRGGSTPRRPTSVPGSPSTTPLFSPIPFLMRSGDEGMPGAGPGLDDSESRDADDSRERSGNPQQYADMPMPDRDVPSMELGGADRTTEGAIEHARLSGKGVGTHKQTITETIHEAESAAAAKAETHGEANEEAPTVNEPRGDDAGEEEASTSASTSLDRSAPTAVPSSTSVSSDDASDVQPAGRLATGTTLNEPLGVPAGAVDEMDQVGSKHGQLPPLEHGAVAGGARALSSTTARTVSQESSSSSKCDGDSAASASEERTRRPNDSANDAAETDSGRMLKRVRSERHLVGDRPPS